MSSKKSISTRRASQLPVKGKSYSPDVPAKILDVMVGSKTVAHVCVELGISKTTYYEWLKIYPEMKDAHNRARAAQEVYYLDVGTDAMFGKIDNFNTKMYQILTQNQLHWGMPDQINGQGGQQINVQNLQINQMSTSDLEEKLLEQLKKTGMIKSDDGSTEQT